MIGVKIQQIILADPSIFTADITDATSAKALITAVNAAVTAKTAMQITNVHGKTWQITESDANVASYSNQLTNEVYRRDLTPGDLSIAFTMGEYDEALKAYLKGGTTIKKGGTDADKDNVIGYKGSTTFSETRKAMFCLTQDGYWFIYPKALISAGTKSTDDAAGLSVMAYPEKPSAVAGMATEYNLNSALLA